MKSVCVCLVFCSLPLCAGGESVPSMLGGGDSKKVDSSLLIMNEKTKKVDHVDDTIVTDCDCRNAMRLCALCSASTSVAGCGAYTGGILADSGLLTTAAVVHGGAVVMCCGLLGALIGASCPLDEHDKTDSSGKNNGSEKINILSYDSEAGAVVATSMKYTALPQAVSLPQAVLVEDICQTK